MNILVDYVDRPTLAAALNVSLRTIARYECQANGLPSVMLGGRKLYRLESVHKWIEARETHPHRRRKAA